MKKTLLFVLMAFLVASCGKEMILENPVETMGSEQNSELSEMEQTAVRDSMVPVIMDTNSVLFDLMQRKKNEPSTKASSYEEDEWGRQGLSDALFDLRDVPVYILVNDNAGGRYLTAKRDWIHKWYEFHRRYFSIPATFEMTSEVPWNDVEAKVFYLTYIPLVGQYGLKTYFEGQEFYMAVGVKSSNPNDYYLYAEEGGSSYERSFSLTPVDGDSFYIESNIVGSDDPKNPTTWNVWNYVLEAKNSEAHFGKNLYRSNQQFTIVPQGEYVVERIEYKLDGTALVEQLPDFIATWQSNNNTSVAQQTTTSFNETASKTSSFSNNMGVSVQVSAKFNCGIPCIVGGEISTTLTGSYSRTWGESTTTTDTRNYNFPVTIPPYSRVEATARVTRHKMNVRYTAYLKNPSTGKQLRINGIWEGVDCTDIETSYSQYEIATNKFVKEVKMKGIPKTRVSL